MKLLSRIDHFGQQRIAEITGLLLRLLLAGSKLGAWQRGYVVSSRFQRLHVNGDMFEEDFVSTEFLETFPENAVLMEPEWLFQLCVSRTEDCGDG